jgi:hypothetical protein
MEDPADVWPPGTEDNRNLQNTAELTTTRVTGGINGVRIVHSLCPEATENYHHMHGYHSGSTGPFIHDIIQNLQENCACHYPTFWIRYYSFPLLSLLLSWIPCYYMYINGYLISMVTLTVTTLTGTNADSLVGGHCVAHLDIVRDWKSDTDDSNMIPAKTLCMILCIIQIWARQIILQLIYHPTEILCKLDTV